MYTNSNCTLYLKSLNYKRLFIPHCFFTRRTQASYSNIGIDYQESAFVMFDAIDVEFTPGEDYITEGESELELYFSTEEKQIASMEELQKHGAHTIMMADNKNFGSETMRHIELSCK